MMFEWFREWQRRRRFRKLMRLQRTILLWSSLAELDRLLKRHAELEAPEHVGEGFGMSEKIWLAIVARGYAYALDVYPEERGRYLNNPAKAGFGGNVVGEFTGYKEALAAAEGALREGQ